MKEITDVMKSCVYFAVNVGPIFVEATGYVDPQSRTV